MMYSSYKLNKQGDNIQPWRTRFPAWNQYVVPYQVLTIVPWPTCRFLKRQVKGSGIPISLRICHSLLWSIQSDALVLYRRQWPKPSSRKRNARKQSGCLRKLQIAEKRREVNGKGESERYIQLNTEFQIIEGRDKKAFLSEQCKEIEENNRMWRLEISSRKLEISREHFKQEWAQKRTEMVRT